MASFDASAVNADAMSIKLRHAETNGKLSRTAYNLEQAAVSAFTEAVDLGGELSAYKIQGLIAHAYAIEKGWDASHPSDQSQLQMDVAATVEMIVNGLPGNSHEIARFILQELRDMDLLINDEN